jgi:hypothetical protein
MTMGTTLKYLAFLIAMLAPVLSRGQLQLDSIFFLGQKSICNLDSEGDTLVIFAQDGGVILGAKPFYTLKLNRNAQVLSRSTLISPPTAPTMKRIKLGSTYHTLILHVNDTLSVYQSSSDSVLGVQTSYVYFEDTRNISGFRRSGTDEITAFFTYPAILTGVGAVLRSAIARYIPSTGRLSAYPLNTRNGVPVYNADPLWVTSTSNNKKIVSCSKCKRYWANGSWEFTETSDLAVYTSDFQFLTDTFPLFDPIPNFPFGTQSIEGPVALSAVEELPSGNLVVLGTVRNLSPIGLYDLTLSKWSPELQKLQQLRFGYPGNSEFFNTATSLVQAYDGYLYTISNATDSALGQFGRGVYVCKFDTNLNLIDQSFLPVSSNAYVVDVTVNSSGVYLAVAFGNHGDMNVLYRIRNSGVGVGVKRGEQLVAARVYPNPVQELLYWEAEQETQRFVWYDMQGRKLREEQFTAAQRQELNTETLAPGIYLLQAFTPDGRNFTPQRVVVR